MTDPESKDAFGDRMKKYEVVETGGRFHPGLPIYMRMDGRGFSRFTKGLEKPFDARMSAAMIEATRILVAKTHADLGYTQSDEISLVFLPNLENQDETQRFFGGKKQKTVSVMAGMTTAAFTHAFQSAFAQWASETGKMVLGAGSEYLDRLPHFDARAFQVPFEYEATNAVLWRVKDAQRNAVQMAAQSLYSQKQLHKQSTRKLLDMLKDKGVTFSEAYPTATRHGTFVKRVTRLTATPAGILAKMPEKLRDKNALITRSAVEIVPLPEDDVIDYAFVNSLLARD